MILTWRSRWTGEGSGCITPEAIGVFLADVGLQATPYDMRHIMAELDPAHTWRAVSRASFISFIRHGGQPPPSPKVSHLSASSRISHIPAEGTTQARDVAMPTIGCRGGGLLKQHNACGLQGSLSAHGWCTRWTIDAAVLTGTTDR